MSPKVSNISCLPHKHHSKILLLKIVTGKTIEKSRALLATAGMPPSWWGEAVTTLVFLENCSPNSSINFLLPYELWHGTAPNLT
jgi:hypothetical protein